MSRAAILIALSRVLRRQPTPEEFSTFCETAGPGSRVYIPARILTLSEQTDRIRELRAQGMTAGQVARELGCSRAAVYAVCPKLVAETGHEPA